MDLRPTKAAEDAFGHLNGINGLDRVSNGVPMGLWPPKVMKTYTACGITLPQILRSAPRLLRKRLVARTLVFAASRLFAMPGAFLITMLDHAPARVPARQTESSRHDMIAPVSGLVAARLLCGAGNPACSRLSAGALRSRLRS